MRLERFIMVLWSNVPRYFVPLGQGDEKRSAKTLDDAAARRRVRKSASILGGDWFLVGDGTLPLCCRTEPRTQSCLRGLLHPPSSRVHPSRGAILPIAGVRYLVVSGYSASARLRPFSCLLLVI